MNNLLKITNIGGVGVQKNMFLYEVNDEAFLVDCGIGFPEAEDYGVDIIIPDFTYILSIKSKIKGLLLTHAHEDHISATPYLLKEMPLTIYCHPMVQDFLKNKLKDHSGLNTPKFVEILQRKPFTIGNKFKLYPYGVNHSVPNTMGFFIQTPYATVVHQTDFKFDFTPVMDKPIDIREIARLTEKFNPSLLLSDSLGSMAESFTKSERMIEDTFDLLIKDAKNQVFITTISSNISRIQQAINSANTFGRKVVVSGYSIENNVAVAIKHNLLVNFKNTLIREQDIKKYKPNELLYIVPGNYGQIGSTLDKISDNKHRFIRLLQGDTVVFSGDPIPGMEPMVQKMVEKLAIRGAEVIYSELQHDLHVSGHGSSGDLSLMANLIKPPHLCPIGGDIIHLKAYKELMVRQGFKRENIFELLDGESLLIGERGVKVGPKIEIKDVYIDKGQKEGRVESIVINDRKLLSENGIIFVVLPYKNNTILLGGANIYTRGFFHVKENKFLLDNMVENVNFALKSGVPLSDFSSVRKSVEKSLSRFLYKQVGEVPVIVVEKMDIGK